jgi:hypothetical protein
MMQFAIVLSFIFLKYAAATRSKIYLTAAIAAAAVATYSSANALLLWPLLLLIALVIRIPRAFLIWLGTSAIVFDGLYFIGYRFSQQSNFGALFLHPVYFLGFAASYLSMPFGALKTPGFGVAVGLLNLSLMIWLMLLAWRSRLLFRTLPGLVLPAYYLFTLLTIVITAAGRMDPADASFSGAKPVRYLTMPFMGWAASSCSVFGCPRVFTGESLIPARWLSFFPSCSSEALTSFALGSTQTQRPLPTIKRPRLASKMA